MRMKTSSFISNEVFMKISEFVKFEEFRLHAFQAWCVVCHENARKTGTEGAAWPLTAESEVYEKMLSEFTGAEIQELQDDLREKAISLIPEPLRGYAQQKTIRTFV